MAYIPNISAPLKTGQTVSYATGDDGDLEKGNARSYTALTTGQYSLTTDITINGKTHALSNECVQDNRTGLMWARYVPTADIGPGDDGQLFWEQWTLAANSCTFDAATKTITAAAGTPFDVGALCVGRKITLSGTASNDGVVTVAVISTTVITTVEALTDEGPVNTTFATLDDLIWDALDQANANSLGGYADWRIPNYNELISLVDLGRYSPSIDVTAFPSTPNSHHWTSSTRPDYTTYAFIVDFGNGYVLYINKRPARHYLRLVRG